MDFRVYFTENILVGAYNVWQKKNNTFRKELLFKAETMKGPIMGYKRT